MLHHQMVLLHMQLSSPRSALNNSLWKELDRTHHVMIWLVGYTSTLVFISHVDENGKTAYRRRKGRGTHPVLVDFGVLLFMSLLLLL